MHVTFLGTGAGNYEGSRRQPCSAFVEGILLDCGAGATGRLQDAGLFDRVDAIVITHLHADHIAGLFDFLMHTIIAGRTRPLSILSPPGLTTILRAATAAQVMVLDPAQQFPLSFVEDPLPRATVGPWSIRAVPLDHTVYNVGYHLASDGASLFYTGDTREPSTKEELRAEILIHESTYADRYADRAHDFGHSTASQAARTAVKMHVRKLFLTHLGSLPDTDTEVLREVRATFRDSEVVEDRRRYEL
jgi:ribonuclease BN (tRNA processing enzyme)